MVNGSIRTATGTPVPASGTQATLWAKTSTATATLNGAGRVDVGAIGDFCRGWPKIRVTVDGKTAGDLLIVDAKRYGSYPVGPQLATGRHTVSIRFVNDVSGGGCDRNVHIGSVKIVPRGAAVPVTPAKPVPTTTTAKPAPTTTPAKPTPTTTAANPVPTTTTVKPTPTTTTKPPSSTPPPPAPPSSGGPAGPANTGVPDGTSLTVHNGDLTVTTPGTVIDAMDIRGFLDIRADNVTVKRSLIRGRDPGNTNLSLVSVFGNTRNFTITDSTLKPDVRSPMLDGLKGRQFVASRLDVSGTVDTALVFGDNVTIQNSWFHDTTYFTPFAQQSDNQTHNDNLQIEGGNNIRVTGNTFEEAHNAAIQITQNYARATGS